MINIERNKTETIEFDIELHGMNGDSSPEVRFCVIHSDVTCVYHCKKATGKNTYSVEIPAMIEAKEGEEFDYSIEIIANGYFFEAHTGQLKIVAAPTVTASEPKKTVPEKDSNTVENTKTKPVAKEEKPKKEVKPVAPVKKSRNTKPIKETVKSNPISPDPIKPKIEPTIHNVQTKEDRQEAIKKAVGELQKDRELRKLNNQRVNDILTEFRKKDEVTKSQTEKTPEEVEMALLELRKEKDQKIKQILAESNKKTPLH
jgi:hypothetical protein